jgi:hypothetical protein
MLWAFFFALPHSVLPHFRTLLFDCLFVSPFVFSLLQPVGFSSEDASARRGLENLEPELVDTVVTFNEASNPLKVGACVCVLFVYIYIYIHVCVCVCVCVCVLVCAL